MAFQEVMNRSVETKESNKRFTRAVVATLSASALVLSGCASSKEELRNLLDELNPKERFQYDYIESQQYQDYIQTCLEDSAYDSTAPDLAPIVDNSRIVTFSQDPEKGTFIVTAENGAALSFLLEDLDQNKHSLRPADQATQDTLTIEGCIGGLPYDRNEREAFLAGE